MSSKSSSLNLYDAVTGSKHFCQRVATDQVDMHSINLPINLRGMQINFTNSDGQTVTNVVAKIKAMDAAHAAEVTARQTAVGNEEKNREDAEDDLTGLIDTERQSRIDADSAEVTARNNADVVIHNAINAEAGARAGAVTAEQGARSSADSTLQFNIDEEKTARGNADTSLSNRINAETTDRGSAINAAFNDLSGLVDEVRTAVENELLDRENAVSGVSDGLADEIAERGAAVTAEQLARSNADDSLSSNIDTERDERLEEVRVERERIDAMLSGSDINLNQLHELVTAYQSSDSDILLQIGAITASINGLQANLTALTQRVNTLVIEPN
jgi:hypothetical protein